MTVQNVRELIYSLKDLQQKKENGENSNMFLETRVNDHGNVILQGNTDGLLYLAECALKLAQLKIENKHYNFDDASVLDYCEKDIILSYKKAPWKNEYL